MFLHKISAQEAIRQPRYWTLSENAPIQGLRNWESAPLVWAWPARSGWKKLETRPNEIGAQLERIVSF